METAVASTSSQGNSSAYPLDELTAWFKAITPPVLPQSTVLPQQQICALNDTSQNMRRMQAAELPPPPSLYQTTLTNMPILPSYTGTTSRYVRGQTRATRGRGRRRRTDVDPRTRVNTIIPVSSAEQYPAIPYIGPYPTTYSQANTYSDPGNRIYTWNPALPTYPSNSTTNNLCPQPLSNYPSTSTTSIVCPQPLSIYPSTSTTNARPKAQAVRRLDKRTTEGKRQYRLMRQDIDDPSEEELNELKGSLKVVENVLFIEGEKAESLQIKKITALLDKMLTLKQSAYAKAQYKKCIEEASTVFNDRNTSYQRKVNTLLILWDHTLHRIQAKRVVDETESNFITKLVDWTLHIILHPSWMMRPAHNRHWIAFCVERALCVVQPPVQVELDRVKHLIDTHNWDCLALRAMMDSAPLDQATRLEEFCEFEGWKLLLVRIKVMCEAGCFDVALSVSTVLVNQLNDREEFRYLVPPDKALLVRDLFLMLLVKCGRYSQLLDYLMYHMRPCSGNNMIGRLSQFENPEIPDKLCDSVPQLLSWCSTLFLIIVLHRPPANNDPGLVSSLVGHWLLYGVEGSLSEAAHGILPLCKYIEHVYTFCSEIYNQFGEDSRSLLIELYVKGIKKDVTALNRAAILDPKEASDIKRRLSSVFSKIADMFRNNVVICREFLLTSFSLHPTEVGLKWLEELAEYCEPPPRGESRCRCSSSDILRHQLCERCGLFGKVVYKATVCGGGGGYGGLDDADDTSLLHADLGLEYADCVTLVDLINTLRPRELNWHGGWPYLKPKCAFLVSFQMEV